MSDPISEHVLSSLARDAGSKPLYRKIAEALVDAIEIGMLGTAGTLPSERALAGALGVSRVTVRRALEELAAGGLLRRRQGARSAIAPRVEKTISSLVGFSEELRSRGSTPGQKWLLKQVALPTPNESMALGLPPFDKVVRLVRIRHADGVPIAVERASIPQAFLPDPDLVQGSLYDALKKLGFSPARGVQRIRAGVMTRAEAEALESAPGNPLLVVERRCFLGDGRAVEFTETRYNGARYDFISELQADAIP